MRNISFRAPKCAKNGIFRTLLIFKRSCDAKINGIKVLPNMSRSKDNQTKKVSQLIECNIRNIFMKKIIRKIWWKNYFQTFFSKTKVGQISGSKL